MHSVLLGGLEQSMLLRRAWEEGLADGRLVFLPYDALLFALPYRNRSYLALGDRGPLQEAYDAVLTISLESGPENHAFAATKMSGGAPSPLETEQVGVSVGCSLEGGTLSQYMGTLNPLQTSAWARDPLGSQPHPTVAT